MTKLVKERGNQFLATYAAFKEGEVESRLAAPIEEVTPLEDLIKNLDNVNPQKVITRLNKLLGAEVEELNGNNYDVSHILTFKDEKKVAAMIVNSKIHLKHINKLIQAINALQCISGIIYTNVENVPSNIIKFAQENFIEIIDQETLLKLARTI